MTATRVFRAPARGTVFCLYPLASPSGPLYIEREFLLRSCINQSIHHLHLYRSLYSDNVQLMYASKSTIPVNELTFDNVWSATSVVTLQNGDKL